MFTAFKLTIFTNVLLGFSAMIFGKHEYGVDIFNPSQAVYVWSRYLRIFHWLNVLAIIDGENQKLERKLCQNSLNFCMFELQSRITVLWLRFELMPFDLASQTAMSIN